MRSRPGLPSAGMLDLLKLLGGFAVGLFRFQAAREAEMAFLRQQLLVLKWSAPARLKLRVADRLIFVGLYRLFPSVLGAAVIFQPETLVRWNRRGFQKSGRRAGRRRSRPRSATWSGGTLRSTRMLRSVDHRRQSVRPASIP